MVDDARQSPALADPVNAPFDLPVQLEADGKMDPNAKEKLSEKREERTPGTGNPSPDAQPGQSAAPPAPTAAPPKPSEPATSTQPPTTLPLQELGILPGAQTPPAVLSFPAVDPDSEMPLVVGLMLGDGASLTQESATSNGVTVTETTVSVPGVTPITKTTITDAPTTEVTVECTVPVRLAEPGVVPPSITNPQTIFRTNSSYSSQQLEEDLRVFGAGPVVWAGPGQPPDYAAAQARLTAAMYTPGEQFNDLVWAQHTPRDQAEIEERFAAIQRLNHAGIPWFDPVIATWVDERQKIPIAESPYSTADNRRPAMYSPAELRQQALEASRTALTANDLKQGISSFLVASTVGPAVVLWEAAHDRGDHSGAEIAWAAAELGINTASMVPGLGTLTGAAAKAGLRRVAPAMWEAMAAADNAVDAARIGRATQERQLADAVDNYRQRPAAAEPPRKTGPAPAPRVDDPLAATAPRASGGPTVLSDRPVPAEQQSTRLPVREGSDSAPAPIGATPAAPAYSPFSPFLNPGRFDELRAEAIRFSDRIWAFGHRLNQLDFSPARVAATNGEATFAMSASSVSSRVPSSPLRPGLVARQSRPPAPLYDSAGQLRPRASGPPLLLDFHYGISPTVRAKPLEMVDQLTGQIAGLNSLTAAEVLQNLNTVHRAGNAQKNARKLYKQLALDMETKNAQRLEILNPEALNGLSPEEYAKKIVDDRMKGMAALHEPDIVAGGADVIRVDSNGLPKLGDLGVNSSIGAQWPGVKRDAIRAYAEDLVARGKGHELMNVEWRLNP
ncbi:polymorphic toxin type 15 domain-containing protein [Nocardia sp. JW2]|uniref:polymorphic toxin type 15 domain-containing protein n=1 Tax=Nocardia sp. JW2 TaxID=3450738 RepID=UPI003F43EF8F